MLILLQINYNYLILLFRINKIYLEIYLINFHNIVRQDKVQQNQVPQNLNKVPPNQYNQKQNPKIFRIFHMTKFQTVFLNLNTQPNQKNINVLKTF